jgi:L-ascorbate metabolism protein UlaG (beta-lactamase superfamily)
MGTVIPRADTGGVARPDLHFLGHSTVRVELAGRTVLTDPLLADTVGLLRRVVPLPDPVTWAGVDIVLISHLHGDHLHIPSLRTVGRDVRIVVPRGAGAWLRGRGFPRVDELSAGEALTDGGLTITAVRAEHSGHRWGPRSTHGPATESLGYLLEGGGSTVYASGDTGLFDGMAVLAKRAVDIALLPVWGWGPTLGPGHLDPVSAADAVALIRPRIAVPVHWGTLALAGLTSVPSPLRGRMRRLLLDPPHSFAAEVAARRLDARVVVTAPGQPVVLAAPPAAA